MNRSTSFFWATDDAAAHGSSPGLHIDEDDDEVLEQGKDDPAGEVYGSSSPGLSIDDDEALEQGKEHEVEITDRSHLLAPKFGYGTGIRHRILPTHFEEDEQKTIRFQVVVWHVGEVDVLQGHVPMKFRVTLFWNDSGEHVTNDNVAQGFYWTMVGRQHACRQKMDTRHVEQIDVPPLSILNAASFDAIGTPEVSLIGEDTRLMRWTCMYNAILLQKSMRVDNFPHDHHDLVIKLAVLAHRQSGQKWDKSKWKLDLATESDSLGSTRIPYGLLVDHIHIPGFNYRDDGLDFEIVPHALGPVGKQKQDDCLQVKLTVFRESGHYDQNIMPIMGMLNLIGITCIPRNFAPSTASTELMLSIAFVEIGFRLFIDSRLPSVGYQIKMQKVLNQSFWLLMMLVLESNVVYFLVEFCGWHEDETLWIDLYTALVSFIYTLYMGARYYADMNAFSRKLNKARSTSSMLREDGTKSRKR